MGPPLASSVAAWFNVGLLAWLLHRRGHMAADAALRRRLPRMLAAGLVMCGRAVGGAAHAVRRGRRRARAALGGAGGCWCRSGLAAYGVAGQVLGGFDLREAARMLSGGGGGLKVGSGATPGLA